MTFVKPIPLQRPRPSPSPGPIELPQHHQPTTTSPTSALYHRRPTFAGELTPNLSVNHQELYDSPPAQTHRFLADSHTNLSLPPPELSCQDHPKRRRPSVHPLALLPAFVLGLLVSCYTLSPLQSASRSAFFKVPFIGLGRLPGLSIGIRNKEARVENDHVYFPSDLSIHPIHQLIVNASKAWNDKLNRQSKTLDQAVNEYKSRYGRKPPRGFKEWFEWSVEKKILLVDEYDRVNEVIEPFWALPPHVIRHRSQSSGSRNAYSVFEIKNGAVNVQGSGKDDPRTQDRLRLLESFARHVPDVNITMSPHDGPSVFLHWANRIKHLEHARAGTVIPDEEIDNVEDNASLIGFVGTCPPDSPLRLDANGMLFQEENSVGFIGLDHAKAMDICSHPEWRFLHGFTSWPGPNAGILEPVFSFAQSKAFAADILEVPLEQFYDVKINANLVKSWKDKTESRRLMWRGSTTGIWFDRVSDWRRSHRMRLHTLGNPSAQVAESLRPVHFFDRTGEIVMEHKRLGTLVDRYLSASFVGELLQCSVEDGTCAAASKEIKFGPAVGYEFQNNHKYVLDVDGNSWSGRFRRLLASNSLVFKSTIWPEWYRDHIQPWYHYVPVRIDYKDVFDLMAYFSGDIEGKGGFEDQAEKIANQGKDWVDNHFRFEDIKSHMWRTCLEYARVSSDERLQMDFDI